jgi:hypothetical protein
VRAVEARGALSQSCRLLRDHQHLTNSHKSGYSRT